MAKPRKRAAPKSDLTKDVSDVLAAVGKAARKGSHHRVAPNQALKRVTKLPTAEELLRQTAQAPLGTGARTRGTPLPPDTTSSTDSMPSAAELFNATAGGAQLEGTTEEGGAPVDRTEYLSPPNSIAPERPRAREASYNPDTRQLRIVFRDGGTYAYFGVPSQTWRALKNNRSFGQSFDRLVKDVYQYEKVSF